MKIEPIGSRLIMLLCLITLAGILAGCDTPADRDHPHAAASWEIAVAPTCTAEGLATGTCAECGLAMETELPKLSHTYTETVTQPTCEEKGYTSYVCACGYTYTDNYVAPKGHTFTETLVPPACETEGYTRYTCACGHTYTSDYVAPTGHTLTAEVVPPACETEGYTRYTCVCGHTYTSDYVAPTGHTLTAEVVPPACETEGYTRYTCACGYTYDAQHVPPTGHTMEETVTVPPTCTEVGYTRYVCGVCAHEEDGNTVPPLDHVHSVAERFYATVSRDGFTRHTCEDCGHVWEDSYVAYRDIVSGAYVDNTEILMQGVDTSKWNHEYGASLEDIKPLDWEALKAAGVEFVILKAGSTLGKDPAFEQDYMDAKAAGLQVGAYFYAYSTTEEATLADAEMMLSWLEGKQFELPIYFDVEEEDMQALGSEVLTGLCRVFVERLQEAGYYAALYTNTEWLYNQLDTAWVKENLDVWYARYVADQPDGSSSFTTEDTDFTWKDGTTYKPGETDKRYGIWQYTQCGSVEGFRYHFDFNYAFKDYAPIMIQWGLNGY